MIFLLLKCMMKNLLILNLLDKEESLKLLQNKLVTVKSWPPASSDLLMQIAESCKGLPLTIVVVAGLLGNTKMESWKKILDGLSSGIVSSTEHCRNTLDLSYKHLPDYLKPCLLYFGAFQEYQEISAKRLLHLWVAEGFVQRYEMKRIQDVAEDFLNGLLRRSLIVVSKQRWDGGVKACRIHDLVREFCLQKAKDEHFLHILKGQNELLGFNEPQYVRRICIFSEAKHFKQSKLYCPRARCLVFNKEEGKICLLDMSCIIHNFKLLRVLDIADIDIGPRFPTEIQFLVQLAFLAIQGSFTLIPQWIAKLSNLETFILTSTEYWGLSFPGTLWNLHKLRNLYIRRVFSGCNLPLENLDSSSVLYELDRLSGVSFPMEVSMEKLMRKFPNIRTLKYTISLQDKIVIPEFLSKLESVSVPNHFGFPRILEFCFPAHLRKLALSGFELSGRNISIIGQLPNLEVLKLMEVEFERDAWELEEGDFSKLRFLTLFSKGIVSWRACDDQFELLQKLVLRSCIQLENMPSCLVSISALEMIEVLDCSENVETLVRKIEEEQENFGNSLRIIIQGTR
ncbi:OLC1v1036569C1 [Oldenlandia corymbosa var. corymbosa]|uniref:OLC1v1036569C1 n=1 Tax=Oldenlandia corymbosa var. corymbosa TaxID=529605 RepID=A0AAV1CVL3_OLDCO|nr:OLC1v1036569C1 [Oldenlandia corymbosa var. corymbosa]